MFSSVSDQKPVGPKPFLLSVAVHGIAALVLVYGASVARNNRVMLHPMISPELAENMIYLPPDLSAHSVEAPAAPAPEEEKPALTVPTKEQQEAKLEPKPPEPKPEEAKPETKVAEAKPADPMPAEQPAEQQGGYMRATAVAPQVPNMAAMMAYMAQHHRVSDPQPIYTPLPTVQGKLPPEFGGDIFVDIVIDSEGKVTEAHLMQPLIPSLTEDILSVIRQWRFVPASYNGQSMTTRHQFRLHVG